MTDINETEIIESEGFDDGNFDNGDLFKPKETKAKETFKDKRRRKAKDKRHKDQMSVTIVGIVIYSLVLILIVVGSYVGFKTLFANLEQKKIAAEQALIEAQQIEEQARKEEEEAIKKAEEEAAKKEEVEEPEDLGYQDTVFSVIENVSNPKESLVNTYNFARKKLTDNDNGPICDYEVFSNPETGSVDKVTARQNLGDLYEITDYYFDGGQINYIDQYKEDIDIPIDLSGPAIESRFYYHNNKLVRYIYCENNKATEYTRDDFDSYSEGTRGQFEYLESMMLDMSKIAYKNANGLLEEVVIKGYVLDEFNQPLTENYVALVDSDGNKALETVSNGDGYYEFRIAPSDKEYHVRACRDTLIDTEIYGIRPVSGTKTITVKSFHLAYENNVNPYSTAIIVKDADDLNTPLSGAEIRFREGINNRTGEVFMTGTLGEAGECTPALRSGNYTAEIIKEGYATSYSTFVIKHDCQAAVLYAVKNLAANEFKCVLSYETNPLDLDIRAYDSYGRTVYKSKNDSVGSIVAEVIDIKDAGTDSYSFFVSDFTDIVANDNLSYRLSQSDAKIAVYGYDGFIGEYTVPEAHAGVVWKPIEIRNGKVIVNNNFYTNVSDNSVFKTK